jgi:hypothetical protein
MRRPFQRETRADDLTRRFNLQGGFHNEMRESPDFGGFPRSCVVRAGVTLALVFWDAAHPAINGGST